MLAGDVCVLFFFNAPATTEIYTLSLHDALPIFASIRLRHAEPDDQARPVQRSAGRKDRKSTRLNSSHLGISYAVFCLKKKSTGGEFIWPQRSTSPNTGAREHTNATTAENVVPSL